MLGYDYEGRRYYDKYCVEIELRRCEVRQCEP